jgi:hypothetical protein
MYSGIFTSALSFYKSSSSLNCPSPEDEESPDEDPSPEED